MTTTEKLEVAMKRLNISKKELAEKLNTSPQNLSKKFKFDDWRESELQKICDAIGVSLEIVIKMNDGRSL